MPMTKSRTAQFFGEVAPEIADNLAERRNRPTTEEMNLRHQRGRVMSQPVTRPDVSIAEALAKDRTERDVCRSCTYLAPSGTCLGGSGQLTMDNGQRAKSQAVNCQLSPVNCQLPMCHSACRPGMKKAADNGEIMEITCAACADFSRNGGECLGQAVRLGTENVTAFPPCLKEGGSRK